MARNQKMQKIEIMTKGGNGNGNGYVPARYFWWVVGVQSAIMGFVMTFLISYILTLSGKINDVAIENAALRAQTVTISQYIVPWLEKIDRRLESAGDASSKRR